MRTAAHLRAIAALAFVAFSFVLASSAEAQIKWHTNLQAAHAKAKSEGKLMLLHFYGDNCIFCERLEQGAFQSPLVSQAVNQRFIAVKIHGGNNKPLTDMFKVTKYPTDVVVQPDGTTLEHIVSPQEPTRYVAMLNGALSRATAVRVAARPGGGDLSSNSPTNPSTGKLPVQVPGSQKTSGPRVNQFAMVPDVPAKGPIEAKSVSVKIPSNQPSGNAQAGSSMPELAMQGYCPVSVIKKDEWVEGNPKLGVIHLGKLYLFANNEAMETFLADPVPYTPVLNGIDVVRYFEERIIVPGKRDYGLKDPTHNRMFFFHDEAAMKHFWNEYERYTGPAIMVMEKAVKEANPGT